MEEQESPGAGETAPADTPESEPGFLLPGIGTRLLWVFVSPGRLVDALKENPRWGAALLLSAAVIGLSVALVPVDLFMEANRQAALERGQEFPEMGETAVRVMSVFIPSMAALSTLIFTFLFAGLYTVIFAFVLGDEGTYRQYLAVVSHAWFIAAVFGLLITPLRISSGDPQLTLNLGLFMPFLPEGYIENYFRFVDLTQIWSTLVIAQGAHAIDRRRSFGSAAAILLTITALVIGVVARFA